MAIQSACMPIPSELIMPIAGFALAHSQGISSCSPPPPRSPRTSAPSPPTGSAHAAAAPWSSATAATCCSRRHDLDRVDSFFARFGSFAVLLGRMLPIVRTFIAFPAGVARMNLVQFHLYTFIGSWPWCYALAWVGMKLGDTFQTDPRFKEVFHRFHLGVEALILLAIVWFVTSHWKNRIRTEPA